jgi:hypothetical protein
VKWYLLSAEQGNAGAQYNLGCAHQSGNGVQRDCKAAARWFRLAAEQGHSKAQCNLGYAYYHGEGVSQDYKRAFKWNGLAADQGCASAQYNLGEAYYYGKGVSPDREKAVNACLSTGDKATPCDCVLFLLSSFFPSDANGPIKIRLNSF